jgi:hypothetical protein
MTTGRGLYPAALIHRRWHSEGSRDTARVLSSPGEESSSLQIAAVDVATNRESLTKRTQTGTPLGSSASVTG